MLTKTRAYNRDRRTYELFAVDDDPEWHLYEDFGGEAALVGVVTQCGDEFSVECYWIPGVGRRTVDAVTLDDAVVCLLRIVADDDVRAEL